MSSTKKILMIDDDVDLSAALKLKIEKIGKYEFVCTDRPTEAVQLAIRERPDLILLDIEMPEKDGGEVADDLQASPETATIPVLFLSSFVRPEDVAESGGVIGGRHMASKAMTLRALISRMEAMLAEKVQAERS